MKTCNRCKISKPLDDFARMSAAPDGRQYKCRPCGANAKREWERNNPERVKLHGFNADIRRYGITPEIFFQAMDDQGGGCAICGGQDPRGDKLHIDHDHSCCTTKQACGKCFRGLLCGNCNRGLGMFKDNPELLLAAVEYLSQG